MRIKPMAMATGWATSVNSPTVANAGQQDANGNGVGDVTEFQVTTDPALSPPANPGGYVPQEPITVTAAVTFDGGILPQSCTVGGQPGYLALRPDPYNVLLKVRDLSGTELPADQIVHGPAHVLADPNEPGSDLTCITAPLGTSQTLTTPVVLTEQYSNLPIGSYTVEATYVNHEQDPRLDTVASTPTTPVCRAGETECFGEQAVWKGIAPAAEESFTIGDQCPSGSGNIGGTGCAFALKSIVTLLTINIAVNGSVTTSQPAGAQIRVFNKANAAFLLVAGSANPPGAKMGIIFEADAGRVGTCVTAAAPTAGICFAGVTQTGNYLTIMKFFDPATGKSVYVGRSQTPSSFNATTKLATDPYLFSKILLNGTFVTYISLNKFTVTGSLLEVMAPESAIWDGTKNIYPFDLHLRQRLDGGCLCLSAGGLQGAGGLQRSGGARALDAMYPDARDRGGEGGGLCGGRRWFAGAGAAGESDDEDAPHGEDHQEAAEDVRHPQEEFSSATSPSPRRRSMSTSRSCGRGRSKRQDRAPRGGGGHRPDDVARSDPSEKGTRWGGETLCGISQVARG